MVYKIYDYNYIKTSNSTKQINFFILNASYIISNTIIIIIIIII